MPLLGMQLGLVLRAPLIVTREAFLADFVAPNLLIPLTRGYRLIGPAAADRARTGTNHVASNMGRALCAINGVCMGAYR